MISSDLIRAGLALLLIPATSLWQVYGVLAALSWKQAGTYRDCDWEIAERLKKVAAGKNASPAQTALAWLLSKPYMGSPIIGATSLDQLTSSAQATEFAITSDEAQLLEEPYQFRVSPAN